MKKVAIVLATVALAATAANGAYAARRVSEDGTKVTGKPASVIEKLQNKVNNMVRVKKSPVQKFYLYEQALIDGVVDGRATGEEEYTVWGMVVYNSKKGMVNFNAHGLTEGTEYTLVHGTTTVGTGIADEYGDVHVKAYYQVADGSEETFTLNGGTNSLVQSETRIKQPRMEDDMEDADDLGDEE